MSNAPVQASLTTLQYRATSWGPTGGSKDPSGANLDIKFEVDLIPLTYSSVVHSLMSLYKTTKLTPNPMVTPFRVIKTWFFLGWGWGGWTAYMVQ